MVPLSSASVSVPRAVRLGALRPARGAMTVRERRRTDPSLERCLVAPAGDDEPGGPIVGRFEQFEPFETLLVVHSTGPGGETSGQLVAAVLGNGDGIDLDDSHPPMVTPKPNGWRPRRRWLLSRRSTQGERRHPSSGGGASLTSGSTEAHRPGYWKMYRPWSRSLARMYFWPLGCLCTSTPQKLLPPSSMK